jgi:hypothetical protein
MNLPHMSFRPEGEKVSDTNGTVARKVYYQAGFTATMAGDERGVKLRLSRWDQRHGGDVPEQFDEL